MGATLADLEAQLQSIQTTLQQFRQAAGAGGAPTGDPGSGDSGGGAVGSFTPDIGQKIGADGSLTYDFTGHISAKGVDLLASTDASPPTDRQVRWLRESDGALAAQIYAFERILNGDPESFLSLIAWPALSAPVPRRAGIVAHANSSIPANGGYAAVSASVAGDNGSDSITIYDDKQASGFLQLAFQARRKVAFGLVVVNAGTSLNVAHGLGVVPALVLASPNRNDLNVSDINVGTPDAANVVLRNTSAFNSNVYWLAIG
jgi:hypothetical protein